MTFTDAQLARVPHPLQALHYDGCGLLRAHRAHVLQAAVSPWGGWNDKPHDAPECDCGGRIE